MKLLTLQTDILLLLFNGHFSLHQLLHLRSTCVRLCHLLESRHCIGRRRTIKLFWSFRDIERYTSNLFYSGLELFPEMQFREIGSNDDDLMLNAEKFCADTCDLLVRLFPKVRHLVVYFTLTEIYPDYLVLTKLFHQWQCSLVGLTLFGVFRHLSIARNATQEQNSWARVSFVEAINQFGALKHFDMHLSNLFKNDYGIRKRLESKELWLPARISRILPGLERLYFGDECKDLDVLDHLGPSCTWLGFRRYSNWQNKLRAALGSKQEQSMPLSRLGFIDELHVLNEHFCSELESLSLVESLDSSIDTKLVLAKLSQLKRLNKLELALFDMNLFPNCESPIRLAVPVFSRISNLTIWISPIHIVSDPVALFATNLPYVFPGVICFTLLMVPLALLREFKNMTLHPSNLISFRHCTRFRLFIESCNFEGPFTGLLSRQHGKRFQREKIEGYRYDIMQQWIRSSSSSREWFEIKR